MKKKLLALMLVGAMILSLTACKKKNNNDATQSDTSATVNVSADGTIKQTGTVADYSKYVKLGNYTGIEIAVDAAVVTDEQVKDYKESLVSYFNEYEVEAEHITQGVTAVGDVINLDFSGLLNGEAFAGGTATDQKYTIGGTAVQKYIDDLDRQLAGLEVGKKYDLPCRFPDDYGNEQLNGKDVIFVVTVNYIEGDKETYEWGDELVKMYTDGEFTSADAYEEDIKQKLLATAKGNQESEFQNGVWSKVLENSEIKSFPQEKLKQVENEYISYYTYVAAMYGMDLASFVSAAYGMTVDELQTECHKMAESEVSYIMLACEIFKSLGKTLTDEEFNRRAAEAAEQYGYESAAVFVQENGEDYVRESFIFNIISDYLYENNKMIINN